MYYSEENLKIKLWFVSYMKNFVKSIYLPSPSSLTYMWNFGSLLGMCLIFQIITGLFLAMHYSSNIALSFDSIVHICNDVNFGWIIRLCHANGATLFFICVYFHIARGIYYKSYSFSMTWIVGVMIYLILMGEAFLGYVLPWGQMSYWGATVITNLISTVPYLGTMLVEWIWGGFSVSEPTLTRFFALHFLIPFLIVILVMVHIFFLHEAGSGNPLGVDLDSDKLEFHPFFTMKDILGVVITVFLLLSVSLTYPFFFMDYDNFVVANPMTTPAHIKPEWYFLFAYAILRSIPNKLVGVLALLMSIMILLILPLSKTLSSSMKVYKIMVFMFFMSFILLTWIGGLPVEWPYTNLSQMLAKLYFLLILILYFM
uniref:Cytochrome b n=1 Tax=Macrogyropus costalimai TaxID=1941320 RepID=A0A7S5WT39_9NEOP|nr:cytochrome b [Macrogyropus costalimai]